MSEDLSDVLRDWASSSLKRVTDSVAEVMSCWAYFTACTQCEIYSVANCVPCFLYYHQFDMWRTPIYLYHLSTKHYLLSSICACLGIFHSRYLHLLKCTPASRKCHSLLRWRLLFHLSVYWNRLTKWFRPAQWLNCSTDDQTYSPFRYGRAALFSLSWKMAGHFTKLLWCLWHTASGVRSQAEP
jgi:hypothetical protein